MIAKYPGRCASCGKPITPNVDFYDPERKASYHVACFEDLMNGHYQEPNAETLALADRLGFKVCAMADLNAGKS